MATSRSRQLTPDETTVHQLKITLLEIDPPIWRRVLVPSNTTLGDLNFILQAVMGWTNSHLHEFTIGETSYSDPGFALDDVEDEFALTLVDALPAARSKLVFMYDFGDSWEHKVVAEKIVPREPRQRLPYCLAGERACPPEDRGGPWGYYTMLDAIADPSHEQHEDMMEWTGGEFDAEAFDVDALNKRLTKLIKLMTS